jgi:hypothetical protein
MVMLLRDFGFYAFYLYVGWLLIAVEGFLAFWDNTYFSMCVSTLDFPVTVDGHFISMIINEI